MVNQLNYNFFNTLIFSGIVYGLVFSIVVAFSKKYYSKARLFLVLTVLSMTLSNLQYWIIDIGLREEYGIPKVYYVQFELLILPFFYLFIKKYLKVKKLKKLNWIVIVPFVFGMIYQLSMYLFGVKKPELTRYNLIAEILTIFYNLVLVGLIFNEITLYERQKKENFEKKIIVSTGWLKYTLLVGILIFIIWIVATQLFYIGGFQRFETYYPLWIGISSVIYWVGNKGVIELKILKERSLIRKNRSTTSIKAKSGKDKLDGRGKLLFDIVVKDLEEEKLYLDSNLSLQTVAMNYAISSGYLSQLISAYSDESFTEFINNLRIKEAKRMLADDSYSRYTINAIALESGFNTKSNFYTVFKKVTGITPNEYKKVQHL